MVKKTIKLMKTRRLLLVAAAMAWLCPSNAQENGVWTLEQCIDYAISHNLSVKQNENNVKRQEVQLSTARNQRLPDLNASAGESMNFGRGLTADNTYANRSTSSTSLSLSSSVPLFTGFRIPNSIAISRLNLEAATADLEKAKNDICVQVAQSYTQILFNMELCDVAREQVAIDSMQVHRLQAMYDIGKVGLDRLSQQKASLAQSELTAIQADNNLKLALLSLTQLLELPTPENFSIARPQKYDGLEMNADATVLPSPDVIFADAVALRPEVEAQNLRLKVADKNISLAKADYYPSLSFSAGLGSNYYKTSGFTADAFGKQLKNNFSQYLGLNLNIPIFSRLQTRNAVRSARLDYENQQLALDQTKKTLYKEIQQVYYNTVAALQKMKSSALARQSSDDAFRLMMAKYEQGKANITEFNESKNAFMKSESDLLQARYEYLYQLSLIDFYRGKTLKNY